MYTMKSLISKDRLGTNTQPIDVILNVNATESTALTITGKLGVDVNIGVGNPVQVRVYHSYNGGETWDLITAVATVNVEADGTFLWRRAASTTLIGPTIKITLFLLVFIWHQFCLESAWTRAFHLNLYKLSNQVFGSYKNTRCVVAGSAHKFFIRHPAFAFNQDFLLCAYKVFVFLV